MFRALLLLLVLLSPWKRVLAQAEIKEHPTSTASEQAERYLETLKKHYANGAYELHKTYSDSLLSIAKEHKLTKMHVLALVNQAVYFNNRSSRLKSIELYHEALEECKKIPEDFRSRTVVLVNMGNTYNNIGSYDKAIETMKEVLLVADSTENSDFVKAAALIGLSNNYSKLENFGKTLEYAHRAKVLGEETDNGVVLASSYNNIINVHINRKEYQKALDFGQEALQLAESHKSTKSSGWLLLHMGIANYHLEALDTALDYLQDCVALAADKGLLEIEMFGQEYLAKVYEQQQNFKLSNDAQKKYSRLRDEFLRDDKEASKADLKKDLSRKEEQLSENTQELLAISSKRKRMLIWGAGLFLCLGGLLFFYIKRKQIVEAEKVQLKADYLSLQETLHQDKKDATEGLSTARGTAMQEAKPYKNSSLTPKNREEFKKKILAYMDREKPYLDPDLNQSDLASRIGMSSHHFSEVLHYGFQQNFYNFINSYRVVEAQKLLKSARYQEAKLIAIAFDSGFKSKTSFFRIFKKHTGQTPSEFRTDI